jgi:hypothetical protein
VDDGGQTRLSEHDVSCTSSGVSGTFDRNTHVGTRKLK